jgi:hypothetical protein
MNEQRGFGLRRLLLNLGGKQRAHNEVQEGLAAIARRATSIKDGMPRSEKAFAARIMFHKRSQDGSAKCDAAFKTNVPTDELWDVLFEIDPADIGALGPPNRDGEASASRRFV